MYDVVVIGAGASGLMTALNIENKKVLVLEKNEVCGKKLLLTGGGRCNLSNSSGKKVFLDGINDKIFFKKTYSKFNNLKLIDYFKRNGLELKQEGEKAFLKSGKSQEIVDFFERKIFEKDNVSISLSEEVLNVEYKSSFKVFTNKRTIESKMIVIATGGVSYPSTGSTGFGHSVAKKLGHNITNLYSAESNVFTANHGLSGQTVDVVTKFENNTERGSMLFTHKGLSGEPILNLSHMIDEKIKQGDSEKVFIEVDFLPQEKTEKLLQKVDSNERNNFREIFQKKIPKSVLNYILGEEQFIKIAELSRNRRNSLIREIKSKKIEIKSVSGLESSIATAGGVNLKNVCPHTFKSYINKNVFFGGEVLDLHGKVGGYNLSIAFITGYLIAQEINSR